MKSRKGKHRTHAVQAIEAAERDYRSLFEGLPVGIYRSTPEGQIADANPGFVRMLGYASRKTLLALHAEELYWDPKDRRRWQSMLKSHDVVRGFEVRLRRRDGSAIWVKETTRSVRDAESCVRYYQGVAEDITERKQEEAALRVSEEKFRRLAETTSAAMFIYQGTRIRYVNRMSVEMTGYGREELLKLDFWELIHPDCRDLAIERSRARQRGEEVPARYEIKIVTKSGQACWVDFTAAAIEMDGDAAVLGTAYDITERKRVEEQLRFSAEILEKGDTLIFVADSQGEIVYVSPYVKTVMGYEPHELLGDGWWEITWGDPAEREREKHRIACCARGEIPVREASYEREVRTRDGESRWLLWQDSQGPDSLLIGVAQDLTERKRLEAQLLYLAAHDPLTGLANRRRFEEELERQLALVQRYHTQGAFLWLDLDQFKDINDTLGHRAGDELLSALSHLLRERLREVDFLARLGGDEFALILVHTDGEQAQKVAQEILERLRHHSFTIQEQPLSVTASIGITLFPQHGVKADEILARADVALYRAKEGGRNRYIVYATHQGWQAEMESRVAWASRIRKALVENRFLLYCQPILDLQSNQISQYELLLRLRNEGNKIISPDSFLSVAERSGQMQQIDRWVVCQAIQLISKHLRAGRDLCLEVNLSSQALSDSELVTQIEHELAKTSINPASLILEITETATIADIQKAKQWVSSLKTLGCQFAMDDFGVGFSSLNLVKHLPMDYLKIDGGFIRRLSYEPTDQHLVQAIVQMARSLSKKTIAEYVTEEATLDLLRAYGVDYAQGYYIARPRPVSESL